MIQVRPHQDDAAFPPFDFEDVAPESVLWLDDLFEDETAESVRVRRRRPQLRLHRRPKRKKNKSVSSRLSPAAARLLEQVSSDSSLAQQLLKTSEPAGPAEKSNSGRSESSEFVPQNTAKSQIRKLRPQKKKLVAPQLKRITRKKEPVSEEEPVRSGPRTDAASRGQSESQGVATARIGFRTPSQQKPCPVRSLNRLAPRLDVKGEKRRRRLKRLRKEIRDSSGSGDGTAKAPRKRSNRKRRPPLPELKTGRQELRQETPTVNVAEANTSDVAGYYRVIVPPPPEEETYSHWFRRVVVRNRWMTWFTTFYLHWIILLIMAAVIVHGPRNTANLILNATVASDDQPDLPPLEITPAKIEPEPVEAPDEVSAAETSVASELTERNVAIDESLLSEFTEETPQSTDSSKKRDNRNSRRQQKEMPAPPSPAPAQAVSEGSFSVWTEPSQPDAGDPYRIIIQIRLPPGIDRYGVSDLQGVVIGSDGYRKPIPGSATGDLFVNDGYARFVVPIVSADAEVRDTIFIRSKLLRETQKLVLNF